MAGQSELIKCFRDTQDYLKTDGILKAAVALGRDNTVLYRADEYPDIEAIDERLDLSEAIAGLPDTYRDVILMKYYQGFSDTEIAELTGMSVDSVRKTIQRARKKLEQELS